MTDTSNAETRVSDVADELASRYDGMRRRRATRRFAEMPYVGGSLVSERAVFQQIAEILLNHVISGVRWYTYVGTDYSVAYHEVKPEGAHRIEFEVPDDLLVVRNIEDMSKIADAILRHLDTDDENVVDAVHYAAEYVRKRRQR